MASERRDRDWELGPWGPAAAKSTGELAHAWAHPTRRQRRWWLALGALLGSMVLVLALAWMIDTAGASCGYRPTDRPPSTCNDTVEVSSGPSGIVLFGAGTALGGVVAASWLGIERNRRRWRQLAEPTVPAAP